MYPNILSSKKRKNIELKKSVFTIAITVSFFLKIKIYFLLPCKYVHIFRITLKHVIGELLYLYTRIGAYFYLSNYTSHYISIYLSIYLSICVRYLKSIEIEAVFTNTEKEQ